MTLTASSTIADAQARQNLSSNLAALARTQPDIRPWVEETNLNVEWVLARDRTLSALHESGQWISGCSLPTKAAESMLKKLDVRGAVAGFLAPTHAAQIGFALKSMRLEQAVVAIIPEMHDLALILHCQNFSEDITSRRLWFAAGPAWEAALEKIFANNDGLATPTQFIRLPDADNEQLEQLITAAQKVFSETGSARLAMLQSLRETPSDINVSKSKICIVAPSRFRLWNDVGHAMLRVFDNQSEIESVAFDADNPANSSPLALLQAARECSVILTANTARTDLPGYLPDNVQWITWATNPRIPSSAVAGIDDHLIVVDPSLRDPAIKAGWPESRVHIGTWPRERPMADQTGKSGLLIVADTLSLDTPKDLIDYSSHMVLWESIRQELHRDPFVLADPNKFLSERMRRLNIGEEGFSHSRFIEKLIIPAYQQSLARILLRSKLPLKLYGQGWLTLEEFKASAQGPVASREHLQQLIGNAAATIHVWPTPMAHPLDGFDATIIRPASKRSADGFVREAQSVLAGKISISPAKISSISAELISKILKTR